MRHQRTPADQKAEILELVRKSPLTVKATLEELGVPRSTYYAWRQRKEKGGLLALKDRKPRPRRVWNQLRPVEVREVLKTADRHTDLTSRELAYKITDEGPFSISESSVYRILKEHGLIFPAVIEVAQAEPEFHYKPRRVHELWQTDLTYFFVVGWGFYFITGILDDYSRYLINYRVVRDMTGQTLQELVQDAVAITGMQDVPVAERVRLLSDNGSGYISGPFNEYLDLMEIRHIFTAVRHPQTIGKFERLNRTAKDKLGLVTYPSPEALERAVAHFQHWYNNERYHEALGNLKPVDVYEGRAEEILQRREEVKRRTIEERRQHNLAIARQPERVRR